ncbi:hypothetical protein [Roseospira visakhapatnamensis]|uniref:Uncharacterized protein n=1 Tax=Roseospira visakhapatnamensis TaxID=390880 RepID=A0A7W6WBN0_9PROT|nr:hypothetical protein [Roseospira visakhapatnamensis]MBB4268189.1 hypothetical protein [Roseospira visakhapatnamensis]
MVAVIMEIGPGRWLMACAVGAAAISPLDWAVQRVGLALVTLEPFPRGVLLMEMAHG